MIRKILILFLFISQVIFASDKLAELSTSLSALNNRGKYLMPWYLKISYKTESQLLNLHLTHDSKYLVEGYNENIVVREVSSGQIINNITPKFQINYKLMISHNDKHIITLNDIYLFDRVTGYGKTIDQILFWNLKTGEVERKLIFDSHYIRAIYMTPDEKYLILGLLDKIILYDLINEKIINTLDGNPPILITNDSKYLFFKNAGPIMGISNEILIWNLENLTLFKTLTGFDSIFSMNLSPDNKYLIIGDFSKNIIYQMDSLDVNSGRIIEHSAFLKQPVISYDNRHIVAYSSRLAFSTSRMVTDYGIAIWDFNTGKIINTMNYKNPTNILFTNENNLIIGLGDKIDIWEKYDN